MFCACALLSVHLLHHTLIYLCFWHAKILIRIPNYYVLCMNTLETVISLFSSIILLDCDHGYTNLANLEFFLTYSLLLISQMCLVILGFRIMFSRLISATFWALSNIYRVQILLFHIFNILTFFFIAFGKIHQLYCLQSTELDSREID